MELTIAEAQNPDLKLLARGDHFVMDEHRQCVGIINVTRSQENLVARRLADQATVRTSYTGTAVGSLAEWMANPNNWRNDQKGGRK